MQTHDHGRIAEWADLVGADVPETLGTEESDGVGHDWSQLDDEAE